MKQRIGIATEDGHVAAHFGRCPAYTIVDIEDGQIQATEVLENPGHEPGRIPRFLHGEGVSALIAGGIGRRAVTLFEELGVEVVGGVEGPIPVVLEDLCRGRIEGGESLCSRSRGDCSHTADETH